MTPEQRLARLIAQFTPEISQRAETILAKLRGRLPGAVELVYDNYNALVVGFGPDERASDAPLSVALYPRRVNLFFLHGAELSDPDGVLEGSGKTVRRVVLESPEDLDGPALQDLIDQAVKRAGLWDPDRPRRVLIRAEAAKRRPRRPSS